jgi:hypothetical protein
MFIICLHTEFYLANFAVNLADSEAKASSFLFRIFQNIALNI